MRDVRHRTAIATAGLWGIRWMIAIRFPRVRRTWTERLLDFARKWRYRTTPFDVFLSPNLVLRLQPLAATTKITGGLDDRFSLFPVGVLLTSFDAWWRPGRTAMCCRLVKQHRSYNLPDSAIVYVEELALILLSSITQMYRALTKHKNDVHKIGTILTRTSIISTCHRSQFLAFTFAECKSPVY